MIELRIRGQRGSEGIEEGEEGAGWITFHWCYENAHISSHSCRGTAAGHTTIAIIKSSAIIVFNIKLWSDQFIKMTCYTKGRLSLVTVKLHSVIFYIPRGSKVLIYIMMDAFTIGVSSSLHETMRAPKTRWCTTWHIEDLSNWENVTHVSLKKAECQGKPI